MCCDPQRPRTQLVAAVRRPGPANPGRSGDMAGVPGHSLTNPPRRPVACVDEKLRKFARKVRTAIAYD